MSPTRIYLPDGPIGEATQALAPIPNILSGLRLLALDNGKPGADTVLERVGEQLAERVGLSFLGLRRKGSAATPCEAALANELIAGADLLLTGAAD